MARAGRAAPFALLLILSSGCAGSPPGRLVPAGLERGNSYPIVLVHGALGFGREELFGYRYWGGFLDLEEELRARGHRILTSTVGPVASNWDRACELYACIKGGRVDYGAAHAAAFGHARYGRSYEGLYPQWGDPDPESGRTRKIHLVGHSLGGPTARTLIQLLAEGSEQERALTPAGELHPLFAGGKSWVCSLLTISSPHDGTTLIYDLNLEKSLLRPVMSFLISVSGSLEDPYYDFKLDQWDLERRSEESFSRYWDRVMASDLWRRTRDTALWDGSPEGARELNRWVRAQPDVYYFSWANEATYREPFSGNYIPRPGLLSLLSPRAQFLGSYLPEEGEEAVGLGIDRTWWQNDGTVNTISMDGPKLGSGDRIVSYSGQPRRGVWNYLGLLESWDHVDVIGMPLAPEGLVSWYLSIASLLASLPD